MSSDTTGFNESAAAATLNNLISGGVTVHLCTTAVDYTDDATDLGTKSDADESVTEGNLSVDTPAGFDGAATITTDVDIPFGSQDIGEVVDIVIQNSANTDQFIVADEINNPNLTGEEYTIEAETVLYNFGHSA